MKNKKKKSAIKFLKVLTRYLRMANYLFSSRKKSRANYERIQVNRSLDTSQGLMPSDIVREWDVETLYNNSELSLKVNPHLLEKVIAKKRMAQYYPQLTEL